MSDDLAFRIGVRGRRLAARAIVSRAVEVHVSGLEHVPSGGAVILAARHYHHLYDAAAILATVPRPIHVLIALDWLGGGRRVRLMHRLARVARWPVVWRAGRGWRLNRAGLADAVNLLREGRVLLVFPEGFPRVDPLGTRAPNCDFLPFESGFLTLARRASARARIVPVGLWYARRPGGWLLWLRFGPGYEPGAAADRPSILAAIERDVRRLSGAPGTASTTRRVSG